MKKHFTKNRLVLYAIREIFTRKKAFSTIFFIVTICLFVLFNLFLFSYGSHLALIERAANDYHVRIPSLTPQEIDEIKELDYVSSVRAVSRTDGHMAYITLINDDPFSLKAQCKQILVDVGIDFSMDTEHEHNHEHDHSTHSIYNVPDSWINHQYYDLTSTPHYMQILPTLFLIFVLSLVSVFFAIRIKTARTQKEYGYMLAIGISKSKITCMTVLQFLVLSLLSLVTSLATAIPILKIVSLFTQKAYYNSYAGVIFAIPWSNLLVITVLFILVSLAFQIVSMIIVLNKEPLSLIQERNTIYVPYVQRSSSKFENNNKILAYRSLHNKRNIRNILIHFLKAISLFALPMILLVLSISYNEGRAFEDDRDFWISSADGRISEEIVSTLKNYELIDELFLGDKMSDGNYSYVSIYCKDGSETECGIVLEQLSDERGFLFVNIYQDELTLEAQANFFAPYFLVQSLLMFMCGLLIIGEDLRYELHTRRVEFSIIRSIGYTVTELKSLLIPYAWYGLSGFIFSALFIFFIMGYVFSIWVSEFMLYPFITIALFATLDFLIHRVICNKHLQHIENIELSTVLSGQE